MEKQATLSTSIDSELKKALAAFCKKRGLKIQSVVENAIREQLEDEIDLASYDERKNEEEISLTAVLKKLKKSVLRFTRSFLKRVQLKNSRVCLKKSNRKY